MMERSLGKTCAMLNKLGREKTEAMGKIKTKIVWYNAGHMPMSGLICSQQMLMYTFLCTNQYLLRPATTRNWASAQSMLGLPILTAVALGKTMGGEKPEHLTPNSRKSAKASLDENDGAQNNMELCRLLPGRQFVQSPKLASGFNLFFPDRELVDFQVFRLQSKNIVGEDFYDGKSRRCVNPT